MSKHGFSFAHLGIIYRKETGEEPPDYQVIRGMMLRGDIPADFISGRWYISEENKPIAIEAIRRHNSANSRKAA